jgi:hypothetical protein
MEQVPDSPITPKHLGQFIAGLSDGNYEDVKTMVLAILPLLLYPVIFIIWFIGIPKNILQYWVIYLVIYLILIVLMYFAINVLYNKISNACENYAITVFYRTNMVQHILSLPSDIHAFFGWMNLWLSGEKMHAKDGYHTVRRRLKAIRVCFGVWSKFFGYAPEPPIVRTTRLISCGIVVCCWVVSFYIMKLSIFIGKANLSENSSTNPRLLIPFLLAYVTVLIIFIWLYVVGTARSVGIRKALISYITTETAGDAKKSTGALQTDTAQQGQGG